METFAELSQGKNHCADRIGGCVGTRARLDIDEQKKVSCPSRYSEPRSVQPIAIRYIDYPVVVVAIVTTVNSINLICPNKGFTRIFKTLT